MSFSEDIGETGYFYFKDQYIILIIPNINQHAIYKSSIKLHLSHNSVTINSKPLQKWLVAQGQFVVPGLLVVMQCVGAVCNAVIHHNNSIPV